jgi:arylformamidase
VSEPYVDLTLPIWEGTPFHPNHFAAEISQYASIDRNGFEARRLVLSSHLGTHIDAPRHYIPDAGSVDDFALDTLIGTYQVVQIGERGPGAKIGADDLPSEIATRVFIATGWSESHLGDPDYFTAPPVLELAAARRLNESGTRIVGIDGPTVDLDDTVHNALLGAGCLIVENLTNLTKLGSAAHAMVLPLPVRGGDGCPVRAIAQPIR